MNRRCPRHHDGISRCAASVVQRSMMFQFVACTCVFLTLTDTGIGRDQMYYIYTMRWPSSGCKVSTVTATPTGYYSSGACCEHNAYYHIVSAHHLTLTFDEDLTSVVVGHLSGTVPKSPG